MHGRKVIVRGVIVWYGSERRMDQGFVMNHPESNHAYPSHLEE